MMNSSAPNCLRCGHATTLKNLRAAQRAYACLEKLIGPQRTSDEEEVCPSRTELSALMGMINEELQRRIETVDATTQALRVALSKGRAS
ncbi:hypothetical protein J2W28_000632 [Variovorax boronicumulans]|uniref:hypothetical protein n=1 Tax=Variovorax boronicumulans TaxID=436515 RepID=UPI00278547AD|nr:hypothetical protein [Variovorax boronicumulans]MDP9989988.1 hypothetical protein [Variovorax boronicumulans]MDQ0001504.1 hypothetical protein [Variovorax boronicumulans]